MKGCHEFLVEFLRSLARTSIFEKFSDGANNIREKLFNILSEHFLILSVIAFLVVLFAVGHVFEFFIFGDIEPERPFYLIIAGGVISTIAILIICIGTLTIIYYIKRLVLVPIMQMLISIVERPFRKMEREKYRKQMKKTKKQSKKST